MPMATGMKEIEAIPRIQLISPSGATGMSASPNALTVSPTAAANHLSCSRSTWLPRR